VVLATQSPAQLAQLPHRHTVVDSCPTRIYLPNPDAVTAAQAPLYRDLGINDREIAIIAGAQAKRHYYLKSPRGSRLFELGLGPVAMSLLASAPGTSMEETRRKVEDLMLRFSADWPAEWLRERGLVEWANRFTYLRTQKGEHSDDMQLALKIVQ
jgi:type IV secretion system protein VirB4